MVRVLASPKADFNTNPGIITLNNAENVLFENTTADGGSYNWSINGLPVGQTQNISHTFQDTGCCYVTLIAQNQNNCRDTVSKFVCVIEGFNFYMPNCITVNHDHLNDTLMPVGTGWIPDNYLFEIYNRWGARIFKINDPTKGWDGKVNDDLADPLNVYLWRINITDNIGTVHELRGHVTVLR